MSLSEVIILNVISFQMTDNEHWTETQEVKVPSLVL
jgi:hypothetical protein